MNRRKELIEQYKQMKPDMGIFQIRSKENDKRYLETSQNVKAMINRTIFQLNAGNHPNQELQMEWKTYGEDRFAVEVLEKLKYDDDESKTDYSEELAILKYMWEERLGAENVAFYRKKL